MLSIKFLLLASTFASTLSLVWGQEESVSNIDNASNETVFTTTDCSLLALLPFDRPRGAKLVEPYKSYQLPLMDRNATEAPPYAVTHAAAALLAIDHFNSRDNSLVIALSKYTSNCSLNIDELSIKNTESKEGTTPSILVDYLLEKGKTPCAVLGGYAQTPTREASVVATGMKTVTVTHGSEDAHLGGLQSAYSTQMCSNTHPTGEAIVNWLRSKGRTDFLTVIHTSHEFGVAWASPIDNAAKESGFENVVLKSVAPPFNTRDEENNSFFLTLEQVKKSTFRTIVAVLNQYSSKPVSQIQALADAAEELEMNGNDYIWLFVFPDDQPMGEFVDFSANNTNTSKLVQGAAVVRSLDPATLEDSEFQQVWELQDESFVERLNKILPKKYATLPSNYFQQYGPDAGAGFMYDSVMVAAMGKCQEMNAKAAGDAGEGSEKGSGGDRNKNKEKNGRRSRHRRQLVEENERQRKRKLQKSRPTPPKLSPHMKGITSLDVTGVTGRIVYDDHPVRNRNRNRNFLTWVGYNIRDIDSERKERMEQQFSKNFTLWYYRTDILTGGPVNGQWETTNEGPFIFPGGTASAPTLLRDNPNIYLRSSVRITGLTLMSVSLFLSALVALLVFLSRKEKIIERNQPFFLYVLLLGTFIMALSILFMSFDEQTLGASEGDEEPRLLDVACAMFPWFVSLGYILIYGALFMKLWRINRLFQSVRTKVYVKHVLWPFVVLLGITIIILTIWTTTDCWHWERVLVDINEPHGKTIGQCTSEYGIAYISALAGVMVGATILAGVMAYKTKDVDKTFSESSWIFTTIVMQFQVWVVGIPIIVIVRQQSTDAFYLTCVLLICSLSMSTLVLMFGPKLIPIFLPNLARNWSRSTLRSQVATGSVRVSGPHSSTSSSRRNANNPDISDRSKARTSLVALPNSTVNSTIVLPSEISERSSSGRHVQESYPVKDDLRSSHSEEVVSEKSNLDNCEGTSQ